MKTSNKGIELIKSFEGCHLTSYQCPSGVWTIGYGHTAGVCKGMSITQAKADEYLKADLAKFEKYVINTGLKLNQNQFDALVSFTYNCGNGNLKKLINGRSLEQIGDAMLLYNKSRGKVLSGLVRRRQSERALFLAEVEEVSREGEKADMAGIRAYSKEKNGDEKLSANFKVKEFACKDGSDPIFIAPELVDILQKIRNHFGKSVVINSGYRTPTYNKKVGGSTYSQHLYGNAADIKISGVKPKDVAAFVEALMPNKGGIGIYANFTHVDVREVKSRWNG